MSIGENVRVLVFGDSIAEGYWDTNGGWVCRLQKYYNQKTIETGDYSKPMILNLGISGNTAEDVLARLDNETKVRAGEELILVFAIGINDTQTESGVNRSDPERYNENLAGIVQQALEYSDKILLVGLTPCVEARTNPVSWCDAKYTNTRIEEFNDAMQTFCSQNNIPFADVYRSFKNAELKDELLPDGLHPNDEGHRLIAGIVRTKLELLLGS